MKIRSSANLADVSSEWPDSLCPDFENYHSSSDRRSGKRRHSQSQHENDDLSHDPGYEVAESSVSLAGVKFCSRSEAICAELLKRYVPHFELKEGVTFQVAVGRDSHGNTLAVDFLVDGVFFEYHPVRLFKNRRRCGDFHNKKEYREYTNICHSLRRDQRDFFQQAMRSRLTQHYYAKRRAILDQHPMYRRMELVVASTPEEFYFLILKRFGSEIPRSVERFRAIFQELQQNLPS